MKYVMVPLLSLYLAGCGTVTTHIDEVDAIVNTTAAVVKGENERGNCSTGHIDDRKKCIKKSQKETQAISEEIKKHRRDNGAE